MTLKIGGIELPEDPLTVERRSIRAPETNDILDGFPGLISSINQKFETVLTGWLWPESLADELFEKLKNPETTTVTLEVSVEPWLNGVDYTTEKIFIDRKNPWFTRDDQGNTVKAYKYEIALSQLAEAGSNQVGNEGGSENGEATGFFDMPIQEGENPIFSFFQFALQSFFLKPVI